jgi:hypothetical protein
VATAFTDRIHRPLKLTKSQRQHLAAHERLAADQDHNAIFAGDSAALVQEAWQRIHRDGIRPVLFHRDIGGQQEKQKAYLVNMGRIIGHDQVRGPKGVVEYPRDHIELIFDSDDTLVTAYPQGDFKVDRLG